jgi:hypothetical protein
MKGSDRMILLVLPLAALAIGFYLLVISPKQGEISELDKQIEDLNGQIDTASSTVGAAEAARDSYDQNYADIVKLGAAAPEDNDQATFVYSMTRLGQANAVQLRSWEIGDPGAIAPGGDAATPAPTPPAEETPPPAEGEEGGGEVAPAVGDTGTTAPVGVTPTVANVATLPLGATVGPAGLPVTPYSFNYTGTFFDVADLLGDLDETVSVSDSPDLTEQPTVRGRLVTVDGFTLINNAVRGFPKVTATLSLSNYAVPAEQGISAGATPAGPPTVASEEAAALSSAPQATTATVTP